MHYDFSNVYNSPVMEQIFTRLSSHGQMDICITVHQSLGSRDKYFNSVFSSCNVLIVFRSMADKLSLAFLGRKLFPYANKFLQNCMETVGKVCGPYTPLCIDVSLSNHKLNHVFAVRSGNIFSEENDDVPLLYFQNPYNTN